MHITKKSVLVLTAITEHCRLSGLNDIYSWEVQGDPVLGESIFASL